MTKTETSKETRKESIKRNTREVTVKNVNRYSVDKDGFLISNVAIRFIG